MENCKYCNTEIKSEANFCSSCGKSLKSDEELLTCLNCDEPISENDQFCQNCSEPVQVPCPACGIGVKKNEKKCHDCGFDIFESKTNSSSNSDDEIKMAKQVLKLVKQPVRLHDLKKNYSFLTKGEKDPIYVNVIERAMEMSKSKLIIHELAGFPRKWAIKKVGLKRRFLTLILDLPLFIALFLGGLVILIGSATEPGLLDLEMSQKAAVAWAWFFGSYFLYFAGTEIFLGATFGGFLFGVRVVDKFGNKQSPFALVMRNLYKLIPLLGPYMFGPYVKPDHEVVKS